MSRSALVFSDLSTPMWALGAVVESASAIIHADDEQQMLEAICEKVASNHRYPLAKICWARSDVDKSLELVAAAGFAKQYVSDLRLSWKDAPGTQGPSSVAVRTGTVQVNNNSLHNPAFTQWRERAMEFGLQSSVAIPLRVNGRIEGVFSVYSSHADAFGEPEVLILSKLAEAIGFGIATRRERQEYSRVFEKTISALAEALGKRDPYTAGHQKRVADLGVKIADQMDLSDHQKAGVRLAGLVHDIGKIQIPSELLTKPSRLSDTEFQLIKDHPQAGYDILKDINFPWPVAAIVHQHHEKLDGSGYPHGLSGDRILLEARILTAADIVEAMSSHRPYRPALGMEAALAEIRRLRGNQLDPRVVDACLTVFHEQRYTFPQI